MNLNSDLTSGDDHDYCEHIHPNSVREVTVKAFSMAMGIRRPGFHLLEISESDGNSYTDRACLLPDQLKIYLMIYLPCFAITVILLAARSAWITQDHEELPLSEKEGKRRWAFISRMIPHKRGRPGRRRGLGGRVMKDLRDVGRGPLLVFWIVTMYTLFT